MNRKNADRRTHPSFIVLLASTLLFALVWVDAKGDATADLAPASLVDGPTVALALARADSEEGDPISEEIDFFERRLESRPGDALALGRLPSLHLLRFRGTGDAADLAAAERYLDQLRGRGGDDPTVASLESALALATHDFPAALVAARRGLALGDPAANDPSYRLFDALWATGDYDAARDVIQSMEEEPGSIESHVRRAALLDGLGEVESAQAHMETAVRLADAWSEPRIVRAWARTQDGFYLTHSGRPEAAVSRFLEALALAPGYAAALEGLGWIAWGIDEDPLRGEALFEAALAAGGHLDLLPVLAEIADHTGRADRAADLRARFVEQATVDAETERAYLRPLALVLADDEGRLDEALAFAERDLRLRGDRGAWATRALVLARLGRDAEAIADAERAVAWGAPTPPDLHLAGEALLEAGELRRGRQLLREALEGSAELGPATAGRIRSLLDG